jgi:hypothetical protein
VKINAQSTARLYPDQHDRCVAGKPGTTYLAAKNYQADDRRPYAYRTDDYGATFFTTWK